MAQILIVEDEPDIGELIRFHVDREGYKARVIRPGQAAWKEISANPPRLVILDLMRDDLDPVYPRITGPKRPMYLDVAEAPLGLGCTVDIQAKHGAHRVAIEVETGRSDWQRNIQEYHRAQVDRLVLATTRRTVQNSILSKVNRGARQTLCL